MAYGADHVEMPPVENWLTDWDWLDDQWGENAIDIWNSVREQCPVATTERYGRAFMPVTMEAVAAVANDTEHFSSIWVNVSRPDAPRSPAPPITSDPPDHHGHRRLLLPAFSPKNVAPLESDLAVVLPRADRRPGRPRHRRCRSPVRPAHPGARHLQAHRFARGGRRPVPRLDLPQLPVGTARQHRPGPGDDRDDRLHRRDVARAPRTAPGRHAHLHRQRRDRGSSRSTGTSSSATSGCSSSPASTPRGVRSDRGCGTSPSIPTRSSASSPSTTTTCSGTPPPRKSCATTRR